MANDKPFETDAEIKRWQDDDITPLSAQIKMDTVNAYSNNVRLGFTNWDMWFLFGEILGEKDGKLLTLPRARITMSLQHAKAFLQAFQTSIEGFEKDFGEIQILTGPKSSEKPT
jgi:hypothetical protein